MNEIDAIKAVSKVKLPRPRAAADLVPGKDDVLITDGAEGELVKIAYRPVVGAQGLWRAVARHCGVNGSDGGVKARCGPAANVGGHVGTPTVGGIVGVCGAQC